MDNERLVFSALKEHRGWYFVEYAPPVVGYPFATLSLTTLQPSQAGEIAEAMEAELATWLRRYPVPIMASAFTDTGDLIDLSTVRACNHLIGWSGTVPDRPVAHWRIVPSEELPRLDLSPSALRQLYSDIPFRTADQLRAGANARQRSIRLGSALVFVWLVVVPAVVLLVEFNAPESLSWLVLLYSMSQVYVQALKLKGLWPRTASEAAAADEERRMRHHHYHCERNPDGFRRLVAENFERESREQTHREASELKRRKGKIAG